MLNLVRLPVAYTEILSDSGETPCSSDPCSPSLLPSHLIYPEDLLLLFSICKQNLTLLTIDTAVTSTQAIPSLTPISVSVTAHEAEIYLSNLRGVPLPPSRNPKATVSSNSEEKGETIALVSP